MHETKTWICDTCGEFINEPRDGWVEWLVGPRDESGRRRHRGLRLVHQSQATPLAPKGNCQYNEQEEYRHDRAIIADMHLEQFLGPDGLMMLLEYLATEELPKEEVLVMIKRLHIPGYEHARLHFDRAIAEGVFEPNGPEDYYRQSDIRATLEWAAEQEL